MPSTSVFLVRSIDGGCVGGARGARQAVQTPMGELNCSSTQNHALVVECDLRPEPTQPLDNIPFRQTEPCDTERGLISHVPICSLFESIRGSRYPRARATLFLSHRMIASCNRY